jgi:hypothetical protein
MLMGFSKSALSSRLNSEPKSGYSGPGTHCRRTRAKAPVHPVMAEVAFRATPASCQSDGFVGAFLYAGFAPRTPLLVQDDDPVVSLAKWPVRGRLRHRAALRSAGTDSRGIESRACRSTSFGPSSSTRMSRTPSGGVHFLLARDFAGPASPAQRHDRSLERPWFIGNLPPSPLLRANPAQKRSHMGGAHGRVAVFIGIVRQDIDVGLIPAVARIFFFRKPPAMLRGHDRGSMPA